MPAHLLDLQRGKNVIISFMIWTNHFQPNQYILSTLSIGDKNNVILKGNIRHTLLPDILLVPTLPFISRNFKAFLNGALWTQSSQWVLACSSSSSKETSLLTGTPEVGRTHFFDLRDSPVPCSSLQSRRSPHTICDLDKAQHAQLTGLLRSCLLLGLPHSEWQCWNCSVKK